MIRALIFDFDGTILDTETPEWEAWSAVYAEEGCPLPPLLEWTNSIGRGALDPVARFDPYAHLETGTGRVFDRDTVRFRRRAHFATRIANQNLRDGIEAYLRDAKSSGPQMRGRFVVGAGMGLSALGTARLARPIRCHRVRR